MARTSWLALLVAVLVASAAQAATIPLQHIDNRGNAPDTRYRAAGIGAVNDAYKIGQYEISAAEYVEFLNAVAWDDPNGLYNPQMADTFNERGANIQRAGSPGNYRYSVIFDWGLRPVNYVNLWDAARFANWLHNGKPVNFQGPDTTESGAYINIGDPTSFARQPGARFFIPNEDEWYKAAYHDASAGLAASYFDYPTSTNSAPGNDATEATNRGNNANYTAAGLSIGIPYYRSVANEYELSISPYVTKDQGGNVWEWTETALNSNRILRGGAYNSNLDSLHASSSGISHAPDFEADNIGFRIAAIPEPAGITLCMSAANVLMLLRRRVARS